MDGAGAVDFADEAGAAAQPDNTRIKIKGNHINRFISFSLKK